MIAINETNFPDANFRNWLLAQDYGKNGVLTEEDIKGITVIDVSKKHISSLKGIEHFTALTKLDCSWNRLTSLYICNPSKLTSLNVSGCTALTALYCHCNELTSLNVSGCTALTTLCCEYNELPTLDVSGCTALTRLHCPCNELTDLNLSGCTTLTMLDCKCNQLKGAAMDRLIEGLPQTGKEGILCVYDGKEKREKNVCTKAQVTAARAKGWRVFAFNDKEWGEWKEYR